VGLLSQLEVGEEIPEELFVSVAVVLSWVYWLKGLTPEDGPLRR
jgi:flagellar biosynthesis protein